MMSSHEQCRTCKYAQWMYGKDHRKRSFAWCNYFDRTGERHVVTNNICKSYVLLDSLKNKEEARKKAEEIGKETYDRLKSSK